MENQVNATAGTEERLSRRTFLSYTMGGIGRDMAYNIYSSFAVTFMLLTKSLSDSQFGVISAILIACRVFDALNDPFMGSIIESTRTKIGKFKPWLIAGAVSAAAVIICFFSVDLRGWSFVIFFGFIAFLWSACFTMNDISYWSMLPSLSSNPDERSKLTAAANLFAAIGAIIVIALVPVFTVGDLAIGGNAISAYRVISIIVAAAFLICTAVTVVGVKEKPYPKVKQKTIGLKKMAKIIFKNDQLLWTSVTMLLYNLGSNMVLAFGAFYVYFEFRYDGTLVLILTAAFAAGAAFINLFYPAIARKITRKTQSVLSIITIVIGYSFFLISSLTLQSAPDVVKLLSISMGILILSFGQSMFYMMLTINIANTVEYNEWKTGERNESVIFSLRPLMALMGSALQQLVILIVYILAGVTAVTSKISDLETLADRGLLSSADKNSQIADVINQVTRTNKTILALCMSLIPIILMTIAFLIYKFKFKIDEKFYQNMLDDLAKRKLEKAENAGGIESPATTIE